MKERCKRLSSRFRADSRRTPLRRALMVFRSKGVGIAKCDESAPGELSAVILNKSDYRLVLPHVFFGTFDFFRHDAGGLAFLFLICLCLFFVLTADTRPGISLPGHHESVVPMCSSEIDGYGFVPL